MQYLRSLLVVLLGLFLSGFRLHRLGGGEDEHARSDGDGVDSPLDLSVGGWEAALVCTKQALKNKNLSMAAAALGYYATLAFFPAILGAATIYTAIAGPASLLHLLGQLDLVLPAAFQNLLQVQLSPLAHATHASLGWATLISLALLLWTLSGGVQNLVRALNLSYGVKDTRGFIKLRLTSIALSVAFLVFGVVILVLLLLQGDALHALGLPETLANLFPILRWPLLVVVVTLGLAVVYRYAPNRQEPRWSWVSWGAAVATLIWLIGTVLFFFYVQHFGNFNKSYGTFASIIILMIWFNLSSLIVLLGAEVNNQLQTVGTKD